MRRIFSVICPKEDKGYFSKAKHKYSNNINVYVNEVLSSWKTLMGKFAL